MSLRPEIKYQRPHYDIWHRLYGGRRVLDSDFTAHGTLQRNGVGQYLGEQVGRQLVHETACFHGLLHETMIPREILPWADLQKNQPELVLPSSDNHYSRWCDKDMRWRDAWRFSTWLANGTKATTSSEQFAKNE